LLAEVDRRIREQWRPAKRLHLDEWADAHYVLPAGDANAGRWRSLPYQRAIMRAISDPAIESVTLMKSSRVGYTKGCICATIAYYIAHDPCPILVVQPTIFDAKKHSREDIAPMLRDVPALRGLVATPKSRDGSNTLLDKEYVGGSLSLVGANSPAGFRRTSRRVVIFDEVDGYKDSAGTEGDPIALATRRSEYYWDRKLIAGSTPTLTGYSKIAELFAEGDQRRYYVPCPTCGALQVLKWSQFKWPEGQPDAAYFMCEANGCTIEHRSKRAMVEAGEWRAEAPEHFTPEHRHASFHIWAAYSYSPNAAWGQLARESIRANASGLATWQTFVNTVRGETFHSTGEVLDWEVLYLRREAYQIGTVPWGALLLTAGVDVQRDRLCCEIVGWGRGKTSWSVDYLELRGETADLERGPWQQLDAVLARTYRHASGVPMSIEAMGVDSGYNTQTVVSWARRHPTQRVVVLKGQGGSGPILGATRAVGDTNRRGQPLKRGYRLRVTYGHATKAELFGFLRLKAPLDGGPLPPGYCHFPEYGETYFKELTAESFELVPKTRRYEYVQISGRANEALDCRCYARAAAVHAHMDRLTEAEWAAREYATGQEPTATDTMARSSAGPPPLPSLPPASAPPPRTPWLGRPRGWLTPR
jgi:phage terminase large subunit GpA-like protein